MVSFAKSAGARSDVAAWRGLMSPRDVRSDVAARHATTGSHASSAKMRRQNSQISRRSAAGQMRRSATLSAPPTPRRAGRRQIPRRNHPPARFNQARHSACSLSSNAGHAIASTARPLVRWPAPTRVIPTCPCTRPVVANPTYSIVPSMVNHPHGPPPGFTARTASTFSPLTRYGVRSDAYVPVALPRSSTNLVPLT